jgi:hypothetical protein
LQPHVTPEPGNVAIEQNQIAVHRSLRTVTVIGAWRSSASAPTVDCWPIVRHLENRAKSSRHGMRWPEDDGHPHPVEIAFSLGAEARLSGASVWPCAALLSSASVSGDLPAE